MKSRKATHCTGGECVEVADGGDGTVQMRDGKKNDGPMVILPRSAFLELVEGVKGGAFDHLT